MSFLDDDELEYVAPRVISPPEWFVKLHYEGDPKVQENWATYQDHKDEGHSRDYILVRVLGLQDPAY